MGFLTVHGHYQPPIVHVLALLHDPVYREANAEAPRMEWPRIPLPDWPDGDQDGAVDAGSDEKVSGCPSRRSPAG